MRRLCLAEEISAGRIVLKQIEGLTIENRTALGKAVPDDVLAAIKTQNRRFAYVDGSRYIKYRLAEKSS